MSDELCPNFIPLCVAGLRAREDIPLFALLKNESLNCDVSPPSYRATGTEKVLLSPGYVGSDTDITSQRHAIDQLDSL